MKLTKEEVLSLPAGVSLNKLVAEIVLGKVPCNKWEIFNPFEFISSECEHGGGENCYPENYPPCYSTDMSAAWQVIESMPTMPGHTGKTLLHGIRNCGWGTWLVIFCSDFGYSEPATAQTAPLAICRAALIAMIGKNK